MKERTATCGCGNIKITVRGDPEVCWACHCDYCQRLTGSIGALAAVFANDQVVSTEGEPSVFDGFKNWPGAERYFCPTCSTGVHWINPNAFPEKRLVSIGCFADKEFPGPVMTVQTQYRHNWCPSFLGAQEFEGFPQDEGP